MPSNVRDNSGVMVTIAAGAAGTNPVIAWGVGIVVGAVFVAMVWHMFRRNRPKK